MIIVGVPIDVQIGLGHNNDKGMFNLTIRSLVQEKNLTGLVDRGYQHPQLVRPDNKEVASFLGYDTIDNFAADHAAARSPGEIINSLTKGWAFASQICSQTPELQATGLMAIYYLVTLKMQDSLYAVAKLSKK